jgi:hypothetical protein
MGLIVHGGDLGRIVPQGPMDFIGASSEGYVETLVAVHLPPQHVVGE